MRAKRGCHVARARSPTRRYDGKLSLVRFRQRFLLYARANLKPAGGGRFVQVAASISSELPTDSLDGFGPFSLITIDGYAADGPGNIYFAAIKVPARW